MGRHLTPGEPSRSHSSSKVAICALRALQERLEQLENERGRAFEKSMDAHQVTAKEIEEMKSSYQVNLNRYKAQQELLQKRMEAMAAEYSNVETSLNQSRDECRDLRKQLADLFLESTELRQNLKQARRQLASMTKENERMCTNPHCKRMDANHSRRRSSKKASDIQNPEKSKPARSGPGRIHLACSDEKVPFFATVAKETHNLKARVQDAMRCSPHTNKTSEAKQQRVTLLTSMEAIFSSITKLLESLSHEPSVKAYKQIMQLLSKIETAQGQLSERKHCQQRDRSTSPDSRRCYERKLRMLSILREVKGERNNNHKK